MGGCHYPFVGGHELLGKVVECGQKVTKVRVGDFCGVGCLVDSCLDCTNCKASEESYCEKGFTATYNGVKQYGRVEGNQTTRTHGGYSGSLVVLEHFVIRIPEGMDLAKTAPILCAGIKMV